MDKKQADDLHHALARAAKTLRHMATGLGPALAGVAGFAGLSDDVAQGTLSAFNASVAVAGERLRSMHESGELAGLWAAVEVAAQANARAGPGEVPGADTAAN